LFRERRRVGDQRLSQHDPIRKPTVRRKVYFEGKCLGHIGGNGWECCREEVAKKIASTASIPFHREVRVRNLTSSD